MERRLKDLEYGTKKEVELLSTFKKIFNCDNLELAPKNYEFDYINNKLQIELKSRFNEYKKYPTTMIGKNKISFADKNNKETFFCFNFTDGLYYIKYDKEKFKSYEEKIGGRQDRGKFEYKPYIYIPICELQPIK